MMHIIVDNIFDNVLEKKACKVFVEIKHASFKQPCIECGLKTIRF